jgi:hypothetical protein
MPKLFQHEGCLSGQCVCRLHMEACLYALAMSDPNNNAMEKRKAQELLQEGFRLLTEQKAHNGK